MEANNCKEGTKSFTSENESFERTKKMELY